MESRLSEILKDKGSRIFFITKETSLLDCAKKMSDLGVGALLVMKDEHLIGIISERDILRFLVNKGFNIDNVLVAEVMTHQVITVTSKITVTEAMRLVTEKRFRHLPVVEDGTLLGMISIGDLTRWAMLNQEKVIDSLNQYIHGS